jgi:CcmD family protein
MEYAPVSALWIVGIVAVATWAAVFFYMLKLDRDLAKAEKRRNRLG